jgi:hypothetical protein
MNFLSMHFVRAGGSSGEALFFEPTDKYLTLSARPGAHTIVLARGYSSMNSLAMHFV